MVVPDDGNNARIIAYRYYVYGNANPAVNFISRRSRSSRYPRGVN
jgi:hypothetical protein